MPPEVAHGFLFSLPLYVSFMFICIMATSLPAISVTRNLSRRYINDVGGPATVPTWRSISPLASYGKDGNLPNRLKVLNRDMPRKLVFF